MIDFFFGLYVGFLHACWISLDARRLGVRARWRRYVCIFFPPLGLWYHLLVTRKLKGLVSIVLSVLFYVAVLVPPAVLLGLLGRL